MGKVLIKCDTCGKEFFKYLSKIGKNNFCCRDCYNKFHSKNVKSILARYVIKYLLEQKQMQIGFAPVTVTINFIIL